MVSIAAVPIGKVSVADFWLGAHAQKTNIALSAVCVEAAMQRTKACAIRPASSMQTSMDDGHNS